jgi:hypothetical protein
MTINTIGDPTALAAQNGTNLFLISLQEGFLVLRNIDLVSSELDKDVPLIAPGEKLDFLVNQAFNIAPVNLPRAEYQQLRIGLDETADVSFHALGEISINNDNPIPFSIDFQLPTTDEDIFDNKISFDNQEVVDSITIDLEKLFSGIDFVTIEDDLNGEVVLNEANIAEPSVQAAFDAYEAFFSDSNIDTMYTDQ